MSATATVPARTRSRTSERRAGYKGNLSAAVIGLLAFGFLTGLTPVDVRAATWDAVKAATRLDAKQLLKLIVKEGTATTAKAPTLAGKFVGARPSAVALRTIPAAYLELCRQWGATYNVSWTLGCSVLEEETNLGQLKGYPGVTSGINAFGCCRGPGQFNTEDGTGRRVFVTLPNNHSYSFKTTSTWAAQKIDGNKDGVFDIFNPEDAVPSTFNYLANSGATTRSGWDRALWSYNKSTVYGLKIMARAQSYGAVTGSKS